MRQVGFLLNLAKMFILGCSFRKKLHTLEKNAYIILLEWGLDWFLDWTTFVQESWICGAYGPNMTRFHTAAVADGELIYILILIEFSYKCIN